MFVDQSHKLLDAALEYLFDLHDRTKTPIVLLGTAALDVRLNLDNDPAFGQLYSRVGLRCSLAEVVSREHGGVRLFNAAEIKQLYSRPQVRLSPDATRYLEDVANAGGRSGSLRMASRLMLWATRIARARADGAERVTVYAADLEAVACALGLKRSAGLADAAGPAPAVAMS